MDYDDLNVYDLDGLKAWFRDGSFYRPDGPSFINREGDMSFFEILMKVIS